MKLALFRLSLRLRVWLNRCETKTLSSDDALIFEIERCALEIIRACERLGTATLWTSYDAAFLLFERH